MLKATPGSAAYDLAATEAVTIPPGKRAIVSTGEFTEFPKYYVGLVCSRSGLAAKHGVFVLNAPGVIDSDYKGEIKVILFNSGEEPFQVDVGDRIAQFLLVSRIDYQGEYRVGLGTREDKGFGSTGK